MLAFLGALDMGGSLTRGCRFAVAIRPPTALKTYPGDLQYVCDVAELPGRSFTVAQARYYGPAQLYPVNTEYQQLTLSFLCRGDSRERRFFDDWLDTINPTSNFNFEYPDRYYSVINIYQYAEWGSVQSRSPYVPQVTYNWRLHRAWPMLIGEQPINWAEQEYLRLQVTFAYKYWDRPNLL